MKRNPATVCFKAINIFSAAHRRGDFNEMQDTSAPKPKERTNSEKMAYKPKGKRPGRPSGPRARKKIAQAAE